MSRSVRVSAVLLASLAVVPLALASRAPTLHERDAIVRTYPASVRTASAECVWFDIRISTLDSRYARVAVGFDPFLTRCERYEHNGEDVLKRTRQHLEAPLERLRRAVVQAEDPPRPDGMQQVTTIGVALFDGAEELDWAGPWEVLAAWAQRFPEDGVRVFTLAPTAGPVTCAKGLRVLPDETWASAPPLDVLVYPGGEGTRAQLGDETVREWLRGIAASGALVTSVCTGSLVLADAGLLDGRPATTWHGRVDELATLGRDIEVRPDARFVDSGEIVTAAGVSAGIDMALHLVARLHSVERAREVRRYIQYDPEPPV